MIPLALLAVLSATPATYATAYAAAQPTDEIDLADGFYGDVSIRKPLTLKGGPGVAFSSIGVTAPAHDVAIDCAGGGVALPFIPGKTITSTSAVRIAGVNHVALRNCILTGPLATTGIQPTDLKLDATGNVIGLPTGRGISVEFSDTVTISGNDVSGFMRGITFAGAKNLTIDGNHGHNLRGALIDGSVIANVAITHNWLHDSSPWNWGAGDHADFIHVWTDIAGTAPATNVTIGFNRMEQGAGTAILGVLVEDNSGQGYSGLAADDNVVLNGNAQAIAVEHATGEIARNVHLMTSGDPLHDAPSIRIARFPALPSNVAVYGNVGHDLYKVFAAQPAGSNNVTVPAGIVPAWTQDWARARLTAPR